MGSSWLNYFALSLQILGLSMAIVDVYLPKVRSKIEAQLDRLERKVQKGSVEEHLTYKEILLQRDFGDAMTSMKVLLVKLSGNIAVLAIWLLIIWPILTLTLGHPNEVLGAPLDDRKPWYLSILYILLVGMPFSLIIIHIVFLPIIALAALMRFLNRITGGHAFAGVGLLIAVIGVILEIATLV